MKSKFFGLALSTVFLALCFPAEAQQPKRVTRIGYLSSFESAFESTRAEAIRLALRERGHIEGQNIAPSSSAMGRGSKIDTLSLRSIRDSSRNSM
jgi:hypothetical protein